VRKKLLSVISVFLLLCVLVACGTVQDVAPRSITIKTYDRVEMLVGDTLQLEIEEDGFEVEWSASSASVTVDESGLVTAVSLGKAAVTAECQGKSDTVMVEVVEELSEKPQSTPEGIDTAQYAASVQEARERAEKGIPAGSLTVPDQAPTIADYRPMKNGQFVRNSASNFIDNDTYVVVDAYGNEVFRIYRGGGYITLEEVAAYVYAFGTVPANYVAGKNAEPEGSIWGEYLRLNHSKFSGNTYKYPYEPELPNISGCGGDLQYYEIDIGTTGTDCDSGYIVKIYNDGQSITRGAARIVYGHKDLDGDGVLEFGEHHVFYTYNHYNDFQEYLNYYGGWGEMFGNVTGGGELSSKYDYNPTPYVYVLWEEFPNRVHITTIYFYDPRRYMAYAA